MRWLTECSAAALSEALRVVAPQLSGHPIEMPEPAAEDDPLWWSSTAVIGGRYVAKFAWSEPAARRVAHELGVLTALAGDPFLPEIVAGGTDPLLLITRRVPGASLFEVIRAIDPDRAAVRLARFLAHLHQPATRARVEAAIGPLPPAHLGPQHPRVRPDRLDAWAPPGRRRTLRRWCEWADVTLARPRPSVLVHADLHGDNQVWVSDELRLVVDFETVSAAEPAYDFRAFPSAELLTATLRHYERFSGRHLPADRVMAWHLRTALDDALWRSEAGVPLPGHRTRAAWIDDVAVRFRRLGIDP